MLNIHWKDWCWRWSSILWPPDVKNSLLRKDPGTWNDWRQEEKGTTEDEIVGWHHWLNGCEFEQVLGIGDGQGSLACCSPWGGKESNMTEQLNWTIKILFLLSSLFCIFTNAGLNIIYFWLLFLGFSGPLISKKCVSHNFSHQFFMYWVMHTFSLFSFLKLYLHIT